MAGNWLWSLVYGILSGFTTFLPISASAHQGLYAHFTGYDGDISLFRLAACIGTLICLLFACRPTLSRFRRERRIAAVPAKRRRRQPDQGTLRQLRVLRVAVIPLVAVSVGGWFLRSMEGKLWFLAAMVGINGLVLYLPQLFRRGNKSGSNMSYLDGLLIGLGSGLAFVPGLSGISGSVSVGALCGCSRQSALDMGLLLSIPTVVILGILSVLSMVFVGSVGFSFAIALSFLLIALSAMLGTWLSILLMRFLAVNIGFSGFSFYCWGMSLLTFILYLSI